MSLARQLVAVIAILVLALSATPPRALAAQSATPQATPRSVIEECAVPNRSVDRIVAALQPPPVTSPEAHANHAVAAGVSSHHATEEPATDADQTHNDPDPGDGHDDAPGPDHDADDHHPASSAATPFEPVGTPRLIQPELPDGRPLDVDSTIVAGVTETMLRYVACANGGDVIGLMSLVTPEFLRYSFGRSLITEADLEAYAAAGRALPPEQRRRLVAIREPRELADGRVVALVDTAPVGATNPNAVDTDMITFLNHEGRYYIDRYLANVTFWFGPDAAPNATPNATPGATPTP